ncbi:MAG TPA: hypothetical protein EYP78_07160 [Candidatus Omnitrophica bacterium]|nr:hypothetical protein [Candidatus Omnitrophota bacterium]
MLSKVSLGLWVVLLVVGFVYGGGQDTDRFPYDTTGLEKYERKVIIKAKVGKGPGEIGVIGEGPIPVEEVLWEEGTMEGPKGIAVDSAGYIFILDALNKRIVKFSPDGEYCKSIMLPEFKTHLEGLNINHLVIGEDASFYITKRTIKLGDKKICHLQYDENGKIIDKEAEVPNSALKIQGKIVSSDVDKFTMISAICDTSVHYYILDSLTSMECTLNVYLPKREGWRYMITPHSFLGIDKKGANYIKIDAFEQTPDLPPKELSEFIRKEEEVVFKYNEVGELVAKIVVNIASAEITREIWALGGDGALYLMKYAFKTVETDELPPGFEGWKVPEEVKKYWRRRYTAPDGYVYVIKFSKVGEK